MKTKIVVPFAALFASLGLTATGASAMSVPATPAAEPAAVQKVVSVGVEIGSGYYGYRPYYSYGYRPYAYSYGYRPYYYSDDYRPYRSYGYRSYGSRSPYYRYPDGTRQERSQY
jgi:hypothetical protein